MGFEILSDPQFWTFVVVGFVAQMIDGALGMAYGTLSTSILLATGVPPVTVSASVHTAQFFTTGLSALSHAWFKNINKKMVAALAISGSIGGITGALLLTQIDGKMIKPWVACYLLFLGGLILWKRFRRAKIHVTTEPRKYETRFRAILGLFSGFLDALGGGWGPMVTTNLIARDEEPRIVIGSVNTAEFFVKTVIAITFIATMAFSFHEVVLGLLAGGIIAAPFGAYVLRFIKAEILITLVGVLIISLSLYNLYSILS